MRVELTMTWRAICNRPCREAAALPRFRSRSAGAAALRTPRAVVGRCRLTL